MRIGIDARYLSHGLVGGLHQYVLNTVAALVDLALEHEIVLYADTKRPFELPTLPDNVSVVYLPYHNPASSLYHDLFIRAHMAHDHLDVAHFPANYGFGPKGVPTVITIQDWMNLLPLSEIIRGLSFSNSRNPHSIAMMAYLHYCTCAALRRANVVLTVSAYSAHELAHCGRIDPQRIMLAPSACPADIRRIEDVEVLAEVRRRLGLPRPFILAEAFKNPTVIVRAWQLLPSDLRERYAIVFFSRSPQVLPIVHEAVAAGYAHFLVRPARQDISALYSMASAFVFPSWIEGFGLTVVEAMTCGAPVITSDRGALPEVVGDAALIVDAEDAPALADRIRRLLCGTGEAQRLRELGFARAAQFSWRNTARCTLDAYQRALQSAIQPDRRHAIYP
jgi:glycosyltransferase involved in cell wall biosynthesis